jgi:hypothetical protein
MIIRIIKIVSSKLRHFKINNNFWITREKNLKILCNIKSILGNKIKLVSNKSDSYIGRNAYFCFKASDWSFSSINLSFWIKFFLNIIENVSFYWDWLKNLNLNNCLKQLSINWIFSLMLFSHRSSHWLP